MVYQLALLFLIMGSIKVATHLRGAKLRNEDNAYFINTWIKYIKNTSKTNKTF